MPDTARAAAADPTSRRNRRWTPALALVAATAGVVVGLVALPPLLPTARAAAAAMAGPGLVTTNDGKTLEGNVTESGDTVTVDANGIVTAVPRADVRSIVYGTPEQRLQRELDAVPPTNYIDRLAVAAKGLAAGELDFAQRAAEDVLKDDPGNGGANAMLDNISRQRRLRQASGTGVRPGTPPPNQERAAPDPAAGGRVRVAGDGSFLNEEQINTIRQAELQPGDGTGRTRPRILFRDDVLKRYVESQKNMTFRDFNARGDVEKAAAILGGGDEAMRADVRVNSDPTAVLDYLRNVEPFVLNGCATSGCHGGSNAGAFVLYRAPRSEAASYTNFFLLNTYVKSIADPAGGAFGGGEVVRRMVDRVQPENSLLLGYLLPPDKSPLPHPAVDGYRGLVETAQNPNYVAARNWIENVLPEGSQTAGLPGPDKRYGLDFGEAPATQPTADK